MSEIVKGYQSKNGMLKTTRHFDDDKPVLILPIEDGKCGPFEKWMMDYLKESAIDDEGQGLLLNASSCREIRAAISRLFEEVESED